MCNNPQTQPPAPQAATPQEQPAPLDKEIQVANLNLQLAQTRSAMEFNSSVAGQVQRQFEAMQRCAKPYAESTIVPAAYRGNIGNCIIALDLSHRMCLPALTVMQNLYVVNGNPSWSSKFLVASINTCGRFTNLRYRKRVLGKLGKMKYNGLEWDKEKKKQTTVVKEFDATGIENWECVAYATELATGETLESDPVTIEMAIQEGWYTKTGSKWVTMPQLMLSYRAAAFWQRVYAPEMSMGFRTVEEERDIQDTDYEEVSSRVPSAPAPQATATVNPASRDIDAAKEKLRARAAKPNQDTTNPAPEGGQLFDMP